jgi:hypothetical protein
MTEGGLRAQLLKVFAAHLENMPELDERAAVIKALKLTVDVKDGTPLKYIIIPEYHMGPAAPTPAPEPPAPADIVRHRGGRSA